MMTSFSGTCYTNITMGPQSFAESTVRGNDTLSVQLACKLNVSYKKIELLKFDGLPNDQNDIHTQ